MCFNWIRTDNYRKEEELTLDEIKKIFGSFGPIQQLTMSGGEPFLREDLPAILDFISHNNNVQQITIPSNGINSEKIFHQASEILKHLNRETRLQIGLSIQDIDVRHDEIVNVKGAFERIKLTYEKLKILKSHFKNLQIGVCICLNQYNKQQFHGILSKISQDFSECDLALTLVRGKPRDERSLNVTMKEFKDAIRSFEFLHVKARTQGLFPRIYYVLRRLVYHQIPMIVKNKKMPTQCHAQSKLIVLQSNGDVYPCEYLDKPLGNIKKYAYSITSILQDNKDILNYIKKGQCYCTWECALSNNIVYSPRYYPAVLLELLKNLFSH
jgi:MoaA/NifB/PqqE/SkfB family radical SAM enzyme